MIFAGTHVVEGHSRAVVVKTGKELELHNPNRRTPRPLDLHVVVAIPDFALSTKEARQVLPKSVELKDAIYNVSHSSLLVAAVATGNFDMLSLAMNDRLHQPYRSPLIRGFDEVAEAATQAGALSVALSGAGPSIAAYCTTAMHNVAEKMSQAFARHQVACDVKILPIDTIGATVQLNQSTN